MRKILILLFMNICVGILCFANENSFNKVVVENNSKKINIQKEDLIGKNFLEMKEIIKNGQESEFKKFLDNNDNNYYIEQIFDEGFGLKEAILKLDYEKLKKNRKFIVKGKSGIDVWKDEWTFQSDEIITLRMDRYVELTKEEEKEFEKRGEDWSAGREWTVEYEFKLDENGILKVRINFIAG